MLSVLIIFLYFYNTKNVNKNILLNLFFGALISFFLVIGIFLINEIPVKNFLVQYILYPFSLGGERIDKLNIDFKNLISQFKYIYIILIPLIISIYFLAKVKEKSLVKKNELIVHCFF